jgi:hypothetical protein
MTHTTWLGLNERGRIVAFDSGMQSLLRSLLLGKLNTSNAMDGLHLVRANSWRGFMLN